MADEAHPQELAPDLPERISQVLATVLGLGPSRTPSPAGPNPLTEVFWAAYRAVESSSRQRLTNQTLESSTAPFADQASTNGAVRLMAASLISPTGAAITSTEDSNYATHTTIDLGGTPTNVALSANGDRAFVVVNGSVEIVDLGSTTPVVTAIIPVGGNPNIIAASADGTRAYVTNSADGTVSIIEANSRSGGTPSVKTVAVGGNPTGISVNSSGTRAYVADTASGTVSIIDYGTSLPFGLPTTPKVTTVKVGPSPTSVSTNTAGTVAYVTDSGSNTVSIIKYNGYGNPTVADVQVDSFPSSVKTDDSGTKAIVYSSGGIVSIIDASGSSPSVVTVPGTHYSYDDSPGFVAISADGSKAFVTEHDSGRVAIIDTARPGDAPVYVTFPDYPHSIVALRGGGFAFTVAHNALYVIDSKTGQATAVQIPADNDSSQFQRVAISSSGNRVIAVDNSGNLTAFYYSNSDGSENPNDEIIRLWIRNIGPLLGWGEELSHNHALGIIGNGLDLAVILDDWSHQRYGEAFYGGAQLIAGNLEFAGLKFWPAGLLGVALDTGSYAIHDYLSTPPIDQDTLNEYIANHPGGAIAGATNGVLGLVANTASHFVPEAVVKENFEAAMERNNLAGDSFDLALKNIRNGRLPWEGL